MKEHLNILIIICLTLIFSLISCDQEGDVTDDLTEALPKLVTTLNVTVDVTIDTSISELSSKTIDDIAGVKLYYGFGSYTEDTELNTKFDLSLDSLAVSKATDTTGTLTFSVKDDTLAESQTPYYYVVLTDSEGATLAESEDAYQCYEVYQKESTHSITLSAASVYNDITADIQRN